MAATLPSPDMLPLVQSVMGILLLTQGTGPRLDILLTAHPDLDMRSLPLVMALLRPPIRLDHLRQHLFQFQ